MRNSVSLDAIDEHNLHLVVWLSNLVSFLLFNGISTFMGYLIPKPSLLNSIDTIQSIAEGIKGFFGFFV